MAQKYALVVGCNYQNTKSELNGCINDANSMYDMLIKRLGFKRNNISLLIDEQNSKIKPTAALIKGVLEKLLSVAKAGHVVFLYFAGHGATTPGRESLSGKDEQAIVMSDLDLITNVDFQKLHNKAPKGVDFIIMSDSCQEDELDGECHGNFTAAAFDVLKNHSKPTTIKELIVQAQKLIKKSRDGQHPSLYCGDDNGLAFFMCTSC